VFDTREAEIFNLAPDQFFVLGDNSPASSDARLWPGQNYVDRELLVGKALFVYWPHPLRLFIPFTDASLSIVPNLPQMGFIR
jgi:signal peptidase I